MAQTVKGATLTVTVRVRVRPGEGKRVEILSDPPMSGAARQRLVQAIDRSYLNQVPDGDYVFERTLRHGLRLLRVPKDGQEIALRLLGDLLLPTNDLLASLIQAIRDIPSREMAGRMLAEAYRALFDHLLERGEARRIRPGAVQWHFCTRMKMEEAIDKAMRAAEHNACVALRDAKRDLLIVERGGKTHAYLEATRDACVFQALHLTETARVLNDLVPDAEARAALKTFRRLADEARACMGASEEVRRAFRLREPPLPAAGPATDLVEEVLVMQGGGTGDA